MELKLFLGQGYLWMVHKTPRSDTWDLIKRSHELWNMFAESLHEQGLNPLEELGWKKTGTITLSSYSTNIFVYIAIWKGVNQMVYNI